MHCTLLVNTVSLNPEHERKAVEYNMGQTWRAAESLPEFNKWVYLTNTYT